MECKCTCNYVFGLILPTVLELVMVVWIQMFGVLTNDIFGKVWHPPINIWTFCH